MIDNDKLWHMICSEVLFSRAVTFAVAALLVLMVAGDENRSVSVPLFICAAYNVIRSFTEWIQG